MCFGVRSVCLRVMLLGASWDMKGEGALVYMASKVSSGLSAFLRLGLPCAAPGSPLGGVGMLGTISAALARSSRNLSNSESVGSQEGKKKKKCELRLRCGQNGAVKSRNFGCPTFTCHTFLIFISLLLENKDNNITSGR